MKALAVEQSLPICCSLAALGGLLEVAATAVTAVPAVREKQGTPLQWWLQWLAVAGNVGLQAIGSLLSHLIATWFGPVSIVVPFFYSATLLSNMLIFGLLGEHFTKNMRVGTHVIVVAVILLPVVGPDIQEGQDISILFHRWYSIAWFILLLLASATSGILLLLDISKFETKVRVVILLVARASSISVNLTVSRAFILGLNDAVLLTFIVIKLVSGAIYTYGIVVQSFNVEQATFVPLNASTIIIVNALTGIIIWEDWKVVTSWYGYLCIFVLLGLGCDLLLSVPLLTSENPEFGATKRASIILPSSSKRFRTHPNPTPHSHSSSRREAWKQTLSPMHHHGITSPMGHVTVNTSLQGVDDPSFITPRCLEHGRNETTPLLVPQKPYQSEEGKDFHSMPSGSPSDKSASRRPLSRIAAWRETVSPVRPQYGSSNDDGVHDPSANLSIL